MSGPTEAELSELDRVNPERAAYLRGRLAQEACNREQAAVEAERVEDRNRRLDQAVGHLTGSGERPDLSVPVGVGAPSQPQVVPGVYRLHSKDGALLYIGGSGVVRHLVRCREWLPWLDDVRACTWTVVGSRAQALTLEYWELHIVAGLWNRASPKPHEVETPVLGATGWCGLRYTRGDGWKYDRNRARGTLDEAEPT